jgi:hypothetical protein
MLGAGRGSSRMIVSSAPTKRPVQTLFPFLCVFHTLILMRMMLVIPAMRAM